MEPGFAGVPTGADAPNGLPACENGANRLDVREMSEGDPSDYELMQRVAGGDDGAFQTLVERYQREVYGTIVRMLGDPTEAEDLAQQVFIRIHQAAPRYQPRAQFRTWMYTILRNLVFNESHRRSKRKSVPLLPSEGEDGEGYADWEDAAQKSPAVEALDRERLGQLDRAIQELPDVQRLAVLLKAHQDMSYEEIAAVLKVSVSATKSLLFRARETLREKVAKYLRE